MKDKLQGILQNAKEHLANAADARALDEARVKFLGKKGELTAVLKQMGRMGAWLCRYRHRPRNAASRFPPERQPSKS